MIRSIMTIILKIVGTLIAMYVGLLNFVNAYVGVYVIRTVDFSYIWSDLAMWGVVLLMVVISVNIWFEHAILNKTIMWCAFIALLLAIVISYFEGWGLQIFTYLIVLLIVILWLLKVKLAR